MGSMCYNYSIFPTTATVNMFATHITVTSYVPVD